MRWLLPGLVLMSVGLGTLLVTVVDNWLRGYSTLWWLVLMLLLLPGIVSVGMTLMTRIR
jgi:hypothetical protein